MWGCEGRSAYLRLDSISKMEPKSFFAWAWFQNGDGCDVR